MCIKMDADECPTGGPYAIIVQGEHVEERRLEYHGKGRTIESSVEVTSDRIDGLLRTVELRRPLQGLSDDHFSFDVATDELKMIVATGCSIEFAQHCSHQSNKISFLPINEKKSVCRAGIQGSIDGNPFKKHCEPFPKSVLLDEENPTCFIQSYRGGLSCCRHNHFLLDKDQDIPWSDQYLEYHLKYRFYFEEFREQTATQPASHKQLVRLYWMTEAVSFQTFEKDEEAFDRVACMLMRHSTFAQGAQEYDVPQCEAGTPPSQCIHVITSQWQVRECVDANEETTAGVELIYAAPHCHAPQWYVHYCVLRDCLLLTLIASITLILITISQSACRWNCTMLKREIFCVTSTLREEAVELNCTTRRVSLPFHHACGATKATNLPPGYQSHFCYH